MGEGKEYLPGGEKERSPSLLHWRRRASGEPVDDPLPTPGEVHPLVSSHHPSGLSSDCRVAWETTVNPCVMNTKPYYIQPT
jgi:hypothetical protein